MALTELRAAQLLVDRHVKKIPSEDQNNLPALCGYLDEVPELRVAFLKGTARREVRDIGSLSVIVRDILDDASISEPGAQLVAGEAVLRVLAQVINLNVSAHASFPDLCREVIRHVQQLPQRQSRRNRTSSGLYAKSNTTRVRETPDPASGVSLSKNHLLRATPEPDVTSKIHTAPEQTRNAPSSLSHIPVDGDVIFASQTKSNKTREVAQSSLESIGSPAMRVLPVETLGDESVNLILNDSINNKVDTFTPGSQIAESSSYTLLRLQSEIILMRSAAALEATSAAFKQCELANALWQHSSTDRDLSENLRSALESIGTLVARAKSAVPSSDELTAQALELKEVAEVLGISPGEALTIDAYQLLRDQRDWPAIVRSATIMASLNSAGLPSWIWPNSLPHDLSDTAVARLVALRRDAVLADDLYRCVEWVKQGIHDPAILAVLSEGGSSGTLVQRLESSWTRAEQLRAARVAIEVRLAQLSDLFSESVINIIASADEPELLLARAEDFRTRLLDFGEHLHSGVRKELTDIVQQLNPDTIELFISIETVRDKLGVAVLQGMSTIASINALVAQLPDTVPPTVARTTTAERSAPQLRFKFEHPLSRATGHSTNIYQATVCFRRRGQPYGIVTLPVRLVVESPLSEPCELTLSVEGDMLNGQPKEWNQFIQPVKVVFPSGVSRIDFGIEIPLTRERASNIQARVKTLSLSLSVALDKMRLNDGDTLSWRELLFELPQLKNPFPGSMQLDVLEQRPLGVEKHFDRLYQLVQQGNRSFIVRAPRRYGKTWLLEGIINRSREAIKDIYIVKDVVASSRDLVDVWVLLAERLESEFNRPVQKDMEDGIILRESALDIVRAEAHRRGIRSIYLMIDEAQSFFSHPQSRRLSERLKERLEGAWGSREGGRAAIRMGFVGQVHLTKLMGGNLLGAIPSQYDHQPITEEDLFALLREAASDGGLQSTSEARQRLVELSGNLWILDKLLEGVIGRCTQKSRPWFLSEDVDAAAEALVDAYRRKSDDTLWRYVRDVLNESDDLDKWVPSETFPIAMALARAREDHISAGELPDRIEQIVRSWGRNLEVLPDRILQALERLKDANIINKGFTFELPMLERLLAARAKEEDPFEDDAEKEALDRLGLQRIRRPLPPTDLEDIQGGGQARIYRGICDSQDVAVRCIRLNGPVARRRFVSELNALDRLNDMAPTSTSDWTDVRSYIPRIVRNGIADDDPSYGIVMYQWIHGHHLREHSLSEDALITVGHAMASVLRLLEKLEIVHRDIHPKNIVLRAPWWRPVLIDFGLARAVSELSSNPDTFAGMPDYIPPEVVTGGAQRWSTAGDVYALGQTLQRCINGALSPGLQKLLDAMTASSALARPTAKDVHDTFKTLDEEAKLNQRRQQLEARVNEQIAKLPPSIQHTAERAKADTTACLIGLIGNPEQRVTTVAEFLENVFARYVSQQRDLREAFEKEQGTKLRWVHSVLLRVNERALRPLDASCAVAVAHLRNANAHSTEFDRHVASAYHELKTPRMGVDGRLNDRVLVTALLDVAGRLGTLLQAREALRRYVQFWLGLSRDT
jgi:serine/threonine protein kinase